MALPNGFLDELRARISLAQVVGRRVAWDQRKSNPARGDMWAPCPFHQEKTASFHVDETKGVYYCFGCHAKGDAVTFLRETENLGFMEAVEALARDAGMPMPEAGGDPARAAAVLGLSEAMEAAVRFFRMALNGARAAEARAYLDRRGVAATTCERFEIGFAPDARTALQEHLAAKGFRPEQLAEAGLVGVPREGGSAYDRFRGRIMFPIRDRRGRAIAFGARAIAAGQEPKYLNSPDTPLFDKGRTLYNLPMARTAAGKAGTVIVAEGYLDVISLAQAGLEHAVAPLGTAITETQLELLWKLAPEPVVALDGDPAGLAAAHRLIDLALPLLGPARSLRFALMPAGQDPDDVVKGGGAAAMRVLLAASKPIVDLLWERETSGQPLDSPERRAALEARLRGHVARIADQGVRGHWEREIRARRTALFATPPPPARGQRRDRRREIAVAASPSAKASFLARQPDGAAAEARVRESALIYGCLNHPALALAVESRLERVSFLCPDLARIRDALLSVLGESLDTARAEVVATVAAKLGRDPLPELAAIGQVRANPCLGPAANPLQAARAIDEALARQAAMSDLAAEIRDAEAEIAGAADEGLTWRVRAAKQADEEANNRALAAGEAVEAEAEAALSAQLNALVDPQSWTKRNKR